MSKTFIKTFIGISPSEVEKKVGPWLIENSAKVVAVSQSQLGDIWINLTIFWEYDYQQAPPR